MKINQVCWHYFFIGQNKSHELQLEIEYEEKENASSKISYKIKRVDILVREQKSQEKASHGLPNDYVGYSDDV